MLLSCLRAANIKVQGIFDDLPSNKLPLTFPFARVYDSGFYPDDTIVIAIGDNLTRRKISEKTIHPYGNIFHPSAQVDESARIMEDTVVLHRCVIQADTFIGRHVIINTGTVVEHDCVIGDFVHLAPGVITCGNVNIGENTLVGAGSIIASNLTIGKNCLIAVGSVVTTNIPDGAIVRGNPARIIKLNS